MVRGKMSPLRSLVASPIFGLWAFSTVAAAPLSPEDAASHGETSLRGQCICVTGQISDYHGKAEIVLTDPSQLRE
jgi:DNA/RNA endonuclease YhcR with UshA esterase domain